MSHILETRVAETTTNTGTGDITLGGALTAHRAFADVCGTGDTTEYVIYAVDTNSAPTGDWEEGKGTYSATNTLTRTTVTNSSNAGSPVNFSAGTKIVILTPLGSRVGAVPMGGTTGQALVKTSGGDFDVAWGAAGPATTDALSEGSANLYHTASRVLGQVLTGLSTAAGTVVEATHTILQAIGFLQKQVSDNTSAISGKQATLVSGTNIKTINSTSLLGSGDIAVSADIAGTTHAATAKTTPVDADELPIVDSEASNALKKLTWSNIKTALTTLFDSAYLKLTGGTVAGGTRTTSGSTLTITETLDNAAVTFPGALVIDQTHTASASGSLVADFRVGGASQFSIAKNGSLILFGGNSTISIRGTNGIQSNNNIGTTKSIFVDVTSASEGFVIYETGVYRDAAGILAQRNSTNAQTFRLYNTYTDASNYERGFMRWNSNVLEIGTEAGGTGAARGVALKIGAATIAQVDPSNGKTTFSYALDFSNKPSVGGSTYIQRSTTASVTLVASDMGVRYVLDSASDQNWTLPASPTHAMEVTFIAGKNKAGSYLRVTANTGHQIQIPGGITALAGYIRSASAGCVVALSYDPGTSCWYCDTIGGTWTIDS